MNQPGFPLPAPSAALAVTQGLLHPAGPAALPLAGR